MSLRCFRCGTWNSSTQSCACLDRLTIFCGDNRDVLPQLGRFDLLLTDPPYGIGRDGKPFSTSSHGGTKAYTFTGWDKEPPPAEVFKMMFQASEHQIIWGGNHFSRNLPPTMGWLVWDKGQRIANSDGELAFTSFEKALRIYTLNRVAIASDGAVHPTQKPLALMKWCIKQAPADVQTVIDPYAGSFTTLRACKDLGLQGVGIEISEDFCRIGARRLDQEVLTFAD